MSKLSKKGEGEEGSGVDTKKGKDSKIIPFSFFTKDSKGDPEEDSISADQLHDMLTEDVQKGLGE